MKLFVVGATGATGIQFVKKALEHGNQVTAFVRNPEKIKEKNVNLKVVKGNIFKKDELSEEMKGHDVVISCLGFPRSPQPVMGYLDSHKAIVEAMRSSNINRLVTMSSWYSDVDASANAGHFIRWMVIPFLKPYLDGMLKMEKYLRDDCQDIDYTVVRPPGLTNGSATDLEMSVTEDYKVNTGSDRNRTSRSDVAKFMLSIVNTTEYFKKMIAITTNKKLN